MKAKNKEIRDVVSVLCGINISKVFDPANDKQIFVHAIASPGADTSDTLTITY